jgi:hypothetical protein
MFQSSPQTRAVRGFVVDQTLRCVDQCRCGRHQRFDQRRFVGRRAGDHHMDRRAVGIGQQLSLGTFARLRWSDGVPPFFAGTNVASPRSVERSSCRRFCFSSNRLCRTRWKTLVSVQSLNRAWQTLFDGNERGQSFHRQPVRSTNRIPSRQLRLACRGLPPSGLGCGVGKSSSIKTHWSSVSCGVGSVLVSDSMI